MGHIARLGGEERCIGVLVGSQEGMRSLGRLRPRWEDTIKLDLKKKKRDWEAWDYRSDSGQRQMADDCKCGN